MVLYEVTCERVHQNMKWGGPDHDDGHATLDWLDFIVHQVVRARQEWDAPGSRQRFIKIAALAVAAVESIDRKTKRDEPK